MSKQTLSSKPTLLEAIMIYLKGGDDKKVLKFTERLEKYYKNQIAARQAKIDTLIDQLSDAEEAFEELKVNINMTAISSASNLDSYCASYVESLNKQRRVIKGIKSEITEEEDAIQILSDLREFNFSA